ncbi:hypothetical protein DFH07DRAFT_962570 [Mycena maculata]|uniref:Uncharacterized protein n=1 Tax=Mycena maculata TaxID=230809 RepID=A0AAD7N6I5_9AGAR|nr:hypothetical protein DFH07DRAFT_962570 [Mycena maculata]
MLVPQTKIPCSLGRVHHTCSYDERFLLRAAFPAPFHSVPLATPRTSTAIQTSPALISTFVSATNIVRVLGHPLAQLHPAWLSYRPLPCAQHVLRTTWSGAPRQRVGAGRTAGIPLPASSPRAEDRGGQPRNRFPSSTPDLRSSGEEGGGRRRFAPPRNEVEWVRAARTWKSVRLVPAPLVGMRPGAHYSDAPPASSSTPASSNPYSTAPSTSTLQFPQPPPPPQAVRHTDRHAPSSSCLAALVLRRVLAGQGELAPAPLRLPPCTRPPQCHHAGPRALARAHAVPVHPALAHQWLCTFALDSVDTTILSFCHLASVCSLTARPWTASDVPRPLAPVLNTAPDPPRLREPAAHPQLARIRISPCMWLLVRSIASFLLGRLHTQSMRAICTRRRSPSRRIFIPGGDGQCRLYRYGMDSEAHCSSSARRTSRGRSIQRVVTASPPDSSHPECQNARLRGEVRPALLPSFCPLSPRAEVQESKCALSTRRLRAHLRARWCYNRDDRAPNR